MGFILITLDQSAYLCYMSSEMDTGRACLACGPSTPCTVDYSNQADEQMATDGGLASLFKCCPRYAVSLISV